VIGVYDSGLGGLGVLAAIRASSPTADIVGLADQANAPYGDRHTDEVRRFAEQAADHLIGHGCDTIVVACNTASTAALDHLRAVRPSVRFVGMEPAVKPAVAHTTSGVIAVLGTTATIEGRLLAKMIDHHAGDTMVVGIPLPGLVELVEDGLATSPATEAFLERRLRPAREAGADTYVLACTHYGFAREPIERLAPGATVIDPADAVARQALRVSAGHGTGSGSTTLLTTGDAVRMRRQVSVILGWDLPVGVVASAPAR
jgi:glutamate racemase